MINTKSEGLKTRNVFIYQYLSFHKQLKFHAQLYSLVAKCHFVGFVMAYIRPVGISKSI